MAGDKKKRENAKALGINTNYETIKKSDMHIWIQNRTRKFLLQHPFDLT